MRSSLLEPPALRAALSESVERQLAGDTKMVVDAVRDISGPAQLSALILAILADESWLSEIADRSYYHPNNFVKLVLLTGSDPEWKLRLHVWWPRQAAAVAKPEDIHSHRWDFTTALVKGSYVASEFRRGAGTPYYRYEYQTPGHEDSFFMEPRGRDSLSQVFQAWLPAGTVYHISHNVLHRIVSDPGQLTSSVMIQGPVMRDSTDVFTSARIASEPGSRVRIERISLVALREELAHFRVCL